MLLVESSWVCFASKPGVYILQLKLLRKLECLPQINKLIEYHKAKVGQDLHASPCQTVSVLCVVAGARASPTPTMSCACPRPPTAAA